MNIVYNVCKTVYNICNTVYTVYIFCIMYIMYKKYWKYFIKKYCICSQLFLYIQYHKIYFIYSLSLYNFFVIYFLIFIFLLILTKKFLK